MRYVKKLIYFRYKTPKDAEAWCCGRSISNAIVQSSVSRTVQSEGVQTSPVDVALLQYLFSQLQPECQLAALSAILVFLSIECLWGLLSTLHSFLLLTIYSR